jgi:DNA replication and repair protein RecF
LYFTKLYIENLRVIKQLSFQPGKRINIIYGSNGSGKSSLIESIYLLARCKSYRSKHLSSLITYDRNELIVSANLISDDDTRQQLGLKKSHAGIEVKVDGKKQRKISDQVKILPLGIITPNIHRLVTEGPVNRRKFLDWGVFHVEHEYSKLIASYKRILSQRNLAMRNKGIDISTWDRQLAEYGKTITIKRKSYLKKLIIIFNSLIAKYNLSEISLVYRQGWAEDLSLIDVLQKTMINLPKATIHGPHRADLILKKDNHHIAEIFSRGEQKIIAILMILSQLVLIKNYTNRVPILLFDDIQSEIDPMNRKKLIVLIEELQFQSFITTMNTHETVPSNCEIKMFHVEHGKVSQV